MKLVINFFLQSNSDIISRMESLLKFHGRFFGTFWACETCAEVGWNPHFKTKEEIENHINKVHINIKSKEIDIDNKIYKIVDIIKENDEEFTNFINEDFDSYFEKIKFFIGCEENLSKLDDINFNFLLKQIESFYFGNSYPESLVKFNHKIHYDTDIISGKETAFVIEIEDSDFTDLENFNHYDKLKYVDLSYEDLEDFYDIKPNYEEDKTFHKQYKNQDIQYEDQDIHYEDQIIQYEDQEIKYEDHDNQYEDDQDIQCNICGKVFKENESFLQHVKDIHTDYFFNEENMLLLKEDLISKEIIASKCKFCLDNFKIKDLHQHTESLHYSEYTETNFNFENDNLKDEVILSENFSGSNASILNFVKINLVKDEQNKIKYDNLEECHEQLKREDRFCDATLDCEDKQIQTHKIILDTCTNAELGNPLLDLTKDEPSLLPIEILSVYSTSIKQEISAKDQHKDIFNIDSIVQEYKQKSVEESEDLLNGYLCDEYEDCFDTKYDLHKSNTLYVPEQELIFCEICGYNTEQKECFKMHMDLNIKSEFSCNVCDNEESYMSNLKEHVNMIHEIFFSCDYCHFKEKQMDAFIIHEKSIYKVLKLKILGIQKKRKGKKPRKEWKSRRKKNSTNYSVGIC